MNAVRVGILGAVVVLVVTGCTASRTSDVPVTLPLDVPAPPPLDSSAVDIGAAVYRSSCAACHGPNLEGAADWKDRNDDGTWRPPPMDSTGHTWHHSDSLLTNIITNGSNDPDSAMVGWGESLSTAEIAAVIEFFKSTWGPDERAFQWTVTWQETQRGETG